MKNTRKYYLIALLVIVFDQATKLWVHYNMPIGPEGRIRIIGEWFKLHYILNPGMAFGLRFGVKYGKLILTFGRILASIFIAQYIWKLAKKSPKPSLSLLGWALVLGGAIGNVIDSTFYGVLFGNAPHDSVTPWFHGQVIDMFYFDVWETTLPSWIPFFGNTYLSFFPIFNLADVAIMFGVVSLLWDKRKDIKEDQTLNDNLQEHQA